MDLKNTFSSLDFQGRTNWSFESFYTTFHEYAEATSAILPYFPLFPALLLGIPQGNHRKYDGSLEVFIEMGVSLPLSLHELVSGVEELLGILVEFGRFVGRGSLIV